MAFSYNKNHAKVARFKEALPTNRKQIKSKGGIFCIQASLREGGGTEGDGRSLRAVQSTKKPPIDKQTNAFSLRFALLSTSLPEGGSFNLPPWGRGTTKWWMRCPTHKALQTTHPSFAPQNPPSLTREGYVCPSPQARQLRVAVRGCHNPSTTSGPPPFTQGRLLSLRLVPRHLPLHKGGFSSSVHLSLQSPRFYTFLHLPLKVFHDFCTLIAFGYEKTALTLEKTALTLEIFSIFL